MAKFKFTVELPTGASTTTIVDEGTAKEMTRAFYYFLLGYSYHPSSIVEAMEDIANEYKEERPAARRRQKK